MFKFIISLNPPLKSLSSILSIPKHDIDDKVTTFQQKIKSYHHNIQHVIHTKVDPLRACYSSQESVTLISISAALACPYDIISCVQTGVKIIVLLVVLLVVRALHVVVLRVGVINGLNGSRANQHDLTPPRFTSKKSQTQLASTT